MKDFAPGAAPVGPSSTEFKNTRLSANNLRIDVPPSSRKKATQRIPAIDPLTREFNRTMVHLRSSLEQHKWALLRNSRTEVSLAEALSKRYTSRELEWAYIQRVLEATRGNKTEAAAILGVDRTTLYRKIEESNTKT